MHIPHKNRRTNGFTLTELLIVVSLILLLIALLLPSLKQARSRAHAIRCMTEMRSEGVLNSVIGIETRYFMPVAEIPANAVATHGRTFFITNSSPSSFWAWFSILDQWAGHVPVINRKIRDSVCPAFENDHLPPTSIGYRASYVWTMAAPHIDYGFPPNFRALPWLYDRTRPNALISMDGPAHANPNDLNYYFYPTPYTWGSGYKEMPYRHLGQANFLSNDGSVVAFTAESVPDDRFKLID